MTTWQIEFDNDFYSHNVTKKPLTIEAEYYQRADDWVTFKDAANKVVYDVAQRGVSSIQKIQLTSDGTEPREPRTTTVTLNANVDGYIAQMERAKQATIDMVKARKKANER